MLEFHLRELGLFGTARARAPQVRGLTRFLPDTEPEPVAGAELPRIEDECRRNRLALLDATDEAYRGSARGRAFAAWLAGARPAELIRTGKGDTSLEDVHRYIVRDAVQWLTLWSAALAGR
ncbi:hypothetical protein [Streptomyces achromogenes]|uniref:hypothetical protein n=1 Tax=Streptomyces achromogenes TaxID=67255 RepID=UPI0036872F2B